MAIPDGFVVVNPKLTIATVDWVGAAAKISLVPTAKKASIATFSNPEGERASSVSWMCEIDWVQSYGTEGSWNVLSALSLTKVVMEIQPEDGVTSVDSPLATFSIYMPPIPFIDAEIGEATEWTLSEKVVGQPVIVTA